jgi:hypothetical protein
MTIFHNSTTQRFNNSTIILLIAASLFFASCTEPRKDSIDLSGTWHYKLDPDSIGEAQSWFSTRFDQEIPLPGTLDDAGIGTPLQHDPAMDKSSLTALLRNHYYVGPAWYQKEVTVPRNWDGQYIELELERVIWESTVWVNDKKVDSQESLIAPHRFDVSEFIRPGKNILTIRIDNGNKYPGINHYGKNYPDAELQAMAHAYTNHTQVKWNGMLGNIRLQANSPTRLDNIQVFPDPATSTVAVTADLKEFSGFEGMLGYNLFDPNGKKIASRKDMPVNELFDDDHIYFTLKVPNPELWHEFNPALYTLAVMLTSDNKSINKQEVTFGFAKASNDKGVLKLNGQRIFLRGNLECAIFPLTGYPPTAKSEWAELIRRAKDYGLNHLRFHSYTPPKAAFEAADEAGFYLQTELPLWSLNVGSDETTNQFLVDEAHRILREYGNHPSFIMFSLGNELQGNARWMINLTEDLKRMDSRRLYMATTFSFQWGFGRMPRAADDYFVTQYTDDGWIRGQTIFNDQAPNFSKDYSENIRHVHVPVISHEIGQYSVFPDFAEIDKYTGNLSPQNFIAIRNDMEKKGLLDLSEQYLQATGKFAALLYKEEIERALRTKGFDGFQLLQLQDFPGQGTALVGLLNAFWESKGIVSGKEFRQFCSEVVPLARFEKAYYKNNEVFAASFEIANFYQEMNNQKLHVTLLDGETVLHQTSYSIASLPVGNALEAGTMEYDLSSIKHATMIDMVARVEGSEFRNSWKFWVYPSDVPMQYKDIVVTASFDEADQALREGKKVFLNPSTETINGVEGKFLPVFWSPVHFPNQPGTMGVLVDENHEAFAHFPTSFHSDWQWWDVSVNARTIQFDSFQVTPLVRMIDNFLKNRNMATVFETRSGNGKLLFSSINLYTDLEERPIARQLKYSLIEYMKSDAFSPVTETDFAYIKQQLALDDK